MNIIRRIDNACMSNRKTVCVCFQLHCFNSATLWVSEWLIEGHFCSLLIVWFLLYKHWLSKHTNFGSTKSSCFLVSGLFLHAWPEFGFVSKYQLSVWLRGMDLGLTEEFWIESEHSLVPSLVSCDRVNSEHKSSSNTEQTSPVVKVKSIFSWWKQFFMNS